MSAELAAEIGEVRDAVAEAVTAAFPAHRPGWVPRHGDRDRTHRAQDVRHHLDFLQTAVELDEPSVFRDYALWCRDLLDAHGIDVALLVEHLESVRAVLAGRLSPPTVQAVDQAVRAGLEALAAGRDSPWAEAGPVSPACHLYIAAAVTGRREAALAIVQEAIAGTESPVDVYVDIFQSALYEVGRRWQTASLTIAEEHMATATTQFILGVLHEQLPPTRRRRGTVVVAGVVGDRHVVGASIVANVLDGDGWDVRFLGSDVSPEAVVAAIDRSRADLLAISVTLGRGVPDARNLIALVRASSPKPPRIVVGGAAFRSDPDLWRAVGADGFAADARSVADVARG